MACALTCIVNNIPGVTDWLIDDGVKGVLFCSDEPNVVAEIIVPFLVENRIKNEMWNAARHFMESSFSFESTAQEVLDLYSRIKGEKYRIF